MTDAAGIQPDQQLSFPQIIKHYGLERKLTMWFSKDGSGYRFHCVFIFLHKTKTRSESQKNTERAFPDYCPETTRTNIILNS
jgi:hypothetical protein